MWQSQSPNLSLPSPYPPDNRKFVVYIWDSVSAFVNKFICTIFLDSTYK